MSFIRIKKRFSEKDIIVYKNVLGAFLVKGAALFVTLYTLPAYIQFFNNNEALGLWFTILSFLSWILNFDLGIGNGLRNYLSRYIALNDYIECRKYISSAYYSIGAIILLASVIFPVFVINVDFNALLNIDSSIVSHQALYISIVIVFIGVMVQFLLKLINSVLYALQLSSINNFIALITNIIILLYVKLANPSTNDNNVIVMSIVHAIAVLVPLLVATIIIFNSKLHNATPKIQYVSLKYIKRVLSLGGLFFVIQIAYMLIMSTNEFLIAKTTCNSDVIDYQAYFKLYSLCGTVFALTLTPIWSVITKAQAENDIIWIKKTYNHFIVLAILFTIGEFLIIPFTQVIMKIWLGKDAISDINIITCVIFAIFGAEMIFVSVLSSIANGLGRLKTQTACYCIGAILKVPLAIVCVKWFDNWYGVMISNIICMLIYCMAEPFALRKYFYSQKI